MQPKTPKSTPPADALEVAIATVWLDDEGIIRTVMHNQGGYGVKEAKEHVAAYGEAAGGKKRPVLADLRGITAGPDREARLYYAGPAASQHTLAAAMLVQSDVTRMLANFFFRFHKPAYPSRMFSDEAEALAWLREFLE